jgi:hypothetical protein
MTLHGHPRVGRPYASPACEASESIAAFIPPIGAIYISSIVFMALANLVTHNTLGYLYFPNWTSGLTLFFLSTRTFQREEILTRWT